MVVYICTTSNWDTERLDYLAILEWKMATSEFQEYLRVGEGSTPKQDSLSTTKYSRGNEV